MNTHSQEHAIETEHSDPAGLDTHIDSRVETLIETDPPAALTEARAGTQATVEEAYRGIGEIKHLAKDISTSPEVLSLNRTLDDDLTKAKNELKRSVDEVYY